MFENLDQLDKNVENLQTERAFGRVSGLSGLIVQCEGLTQAPMGSRCLIEDIEGKKRLAEVVGYKNGVTTLMPFEFLDGIGAGCRVYSTQRGNTMHINNEFIGRVLNALGEPIDAKGPLTHIGAHERPLKAQPPRASDRLPVGNKIDTGVRVVNTFLPICEGQRLGIFSGSGVGKSVLMSMISKFGDSEINVIGLIGERGREVREFIDEHLGEEGMKKSIVVVATSDESPLMRRQAAWLTLSIAEHFRDEGAKVMLMLDSVTRFALAQREIGLSSGEPPTTKGFTPSVFAELPKLLERAGPGTGKGFISAFFTVLVEGGDMDEPVADTVRGIVDGHIVLTRELAERNHFPAIDILKSVSRMVPQCLTEAENKAVNRARSLMATYKDMEELIHLGAYNKGTNPEVDEAIFYYDILSEFLRQAPNEQTSMAESFQKLQAILETPVL